MCYLVAGADFAFGQSSELFTDVVNDAVLLASSCIIDQGNPGQVGDDAEVWRGGTGRVDTIEGCSAVGHVVSGDDESVWEVRVAPMVDLQVRSISVEGSSVVREVFDETCRVDVVCRDASIQVTCGYPSPGG